MEPWQAHLVAAGRAHVGMLLEQFMDGTWRELEKDGVDDIMVGQAKYFTRGEEQRKKAFNGLLAMLKGN